MLNELVKNTCIMAEVVVTIWTMVELKYQEGIVNKIDQEEGTKQDMDWRDILLTFENTDNIDGIGNHGEEHEDEEEDDPDSAG